MELIHQIHSADELRATATYLNALAALRDSGSADKPSPMSQMLFSPQPATTGQLSVDPRAAPLGSIDYSTAVMPTIEHIDGHQVPDTSGVDADGLPWDERIHSGGKSKTAAGVWTRKRGVSDELFNQVRAQIKGISAPTFTAEELVSPQPSAQVLQFPQQFAPGPAAVVVPPSNPVPQLTPENAVTFPMICGLMNEKIAGGKTHADIAVIGQKYGVVPFALIASRPDLWAAAYADLKAL